MSDESTKPPSTSNIGLNPESIFFYNSKTQVKCVGSYLKQDKPMFDDSAVVNIYIAYEISLQTYRYDNYPELVNSLFGAIKLTKNPDIDKYRYSEYVTGFETHGSFSLSDLSGFDKNVVMFVADMSSSVHVNRKKNILILGKGPLYGFEDTTLTAEKEYAINFNKQQNGANSYLFLNGAETINSKQKVLK